MYYLMAYNHSMTEQEAESRALPVETEVTISEDRSAGLRGESLQQWHFARNHKALPPKQLFMFCGGNEWKIDFFTIYGGAIVSERFLALLSGVCGSDIHISHLELIGENGHKIRETAYFVKFTTAANVLDLVRLDFGGTQHDIVGGPNEISEDERQAPLVQRAANIMFVEDKPDVFLENSLPELTLPLFCGEAFKIECERAGMRGPWFWPESELLVVDFAPAWDDRFQHTPPQLVTIAQRLRWPTAVDRRNFFSPESIKLSSEHLAILRSRLTP